MNNYYIDYATTTDTSNVTFKLHNHDEYEIYMFLGGDSYYVVEGKNYSLEPYDMIIIRRHEMHRVFHRSNVPYSRLVLMVNPNFFVENGCVEYEKQFTQSEIGTGNKIDATVVRDSGLFDAFMRVKRYSDNYKNTNTPIIKSIVTEILYLLDTVTHFSVDDIPNKMHKEIIKFINEHYCDSITIDDISKNFYISKYHLCRTFKEATGLTIHKYITKKRITKVRELVNEGKNITDAAISSGFNSYSSFYRQYLKENNISPAFQLK